MIVGASFQGGVSTWTSASARQRTSAAHSHCWGTSTPATRQPQALVKEEECSYTHTWTKLTYPHTEILTHTHTHTHSSNTHSSHTHTHTHTCTHTHMLHIASKVFLGVRYSQMYSFHSCLNPKMEDPEYLHYLMIHVGKCLFQEMFLDRIPHQILQLMFRTTLHTRNISKTELWGFPR